MSSSFEERSFQDLLSPLLQVEAHLSTLLDMQWRLIALSDLFAQRFPEIGQALDQSARSLQVAIVHFQNEKWFLMMALRQRLQQYLRENGAWPTLDINERRGG